MWFDTPYGLAYAPTSSGLREVYARRGYRQVPDNEVVGLQPAAEHDEPQPDMDELRDAIGDEVPAHERAPHDEKD